MLSILFYIFSFFYIGYLLNIYSYFILLFTYMHYFIWWSIHYCSKVWDW